MNKTPKKKSSSNIFMHLYRKKLFDKKNAGFTLIEILLVVAAIAVLAGIVIVAINPGKTLAEMRNADRVSDMNQIYKAIYQHTVNNRGGLHTTFSGLTAEEPGEICKPGGSTDCLNLDSLLTPTYLAEIPVDPNVSDSNDLSGYQIVRTANNRIIIQANSSYVELGQILAVGGDYIGSDTDGISHSVENSAPNNGDMNNDGTLDSDQNNVASMVNEVVGGGAYTSLEITGDCIAISSLDHQSEAEVGDDPALEFPVGIWDFDLTCDSVGGAATVKILLDKTYDTSDWDFYKHDGVEYNMVDGVTYGTQDVEGADVTTITYSITDGGTNDQDGIANGVIEDPAGIGTDVADPTLSSSSPADNAVDVGLGENIVLTMSETVVAGTGNITIKRVSDDSTVETIAITPDMISGSTITIDPSTNLSSSTEYYILIDTTALDDSTGNSYAGINDTTTLSFTTIDITAGISDTCVTTAGSGNVLAKTVCSYTGSDQLITSPVGTAYMHVKSWGASGGVTYNYRGGPGGFTSGTLAISAGTEYAVMVGQGGHFSTANVGTYGFGGSSYHVPNAHSAGGGLTGIFTGNTPIDEGETSRALVIAGGGGSGGRNGGATAGGRGGSGNDTVNCGGVGAGNMQGSGGTNRGGGGGGYEGGGGQIRSSTYGVQGEGGCGYVSETALTSSIEFTPEFSGTPPQTGDSDYVAGIGGTSGAHGSGGNGLFVVEWMSDL